MKESQIQEKQADAQGHMDLGGIFRLERLYRAWGKKGQCRRAPSPLHLTTSVPSASEHPLVQVQRLSHDLQDPVGLDLSGFIP